MSEQKTNTPQENFFQFLTRAILTSQIAKLVESPFPISIRFFDSNDEEQLAKNGLDVEGTILIDPISFFHLKLNLEHQFLVVFEQPENGKRQERVLTIRSRKRMKMNEIRVSRILFFNLFADTQLNNTVVTDIRLCDEIPPNCNEIWLSRLRTVDHVNEEEGLDVDIVDHFQIPRLIYSGDVIAIQTFGLRSKSTVYFHATVGNSPSVANSTTKIFQNSTRSSRFPHRRIDPSRIFVPRSLNITVDRISQLLSPVVWKNENDEQPAAIFVLIGNLGSGRRLAVDLIADRLAVNRLAFDCHDLWNVDGRATDSVVNSWMDQITNLQPCVCQIKHVSTLNGNPSIDLDFGTRILDVLSNAISSFRGRVGIFITATKSEVSNLPRAIAKLVHFEERCHDVDENDRRDFAKFVCQNFPTNVSTQWLSEATRGATLAELRQLIVEAQVNAKAADRHELQTEYFEKPLENRRLAFGEAMGVPKIPTVTWDDIGGLTDVKQLISESLRANLNPKRSANTRRSGVVLHGPPGCGKTLIAKAVANEFKMTFLSVKGPELLNQYVGQSEQNLRNVFEKARLAAPSVIFFDELDSLAPSRGVAGDSGGVMDRLVSQLLAELDDLQTTPQTAVFVMGATNRPDLLDSCLLSPGRFDRLVEVQIATDRESKIRILKPVCKNVNLDDDLDVEKIAELCPSEMSGAELSALISNAAMVAIREVLQNPEIDPKTKIKIRLDHVESALATS